MQTQRRACSAGSRKPSVMDAMQTPYYACNAGPMLRGSKAMQAMQTQPKCCMQIHTATPDRRCSCRRCLVARRRPRRTLAAAGRPAHTRACTRACVCMHTCAGSDTDRQARNAWQGMARRGRAGRCNAGYANIHASNDMTWHGKARQGRAGHGRAGQGNGCRQDQAGQDRAGQGRAWQGRAVHGKADRQACKQVV